MKRYENRCIRCEKKRKKIRIAENAARMNLRVSINPRLFQIILSSPPPIPRFLFFRAMTNRRGE